jgi:hypothetical protein
MRELRVDELSMVAGGGDQCTPENSIGGISNPESVGEFIIGVYEGLIQATSYIIERVANAL